VGSVVSLGIGPQGEIEGVAGWRLLFLVGVFPSLLVVLIRLTLREPESWLRAKEQSGGQGKDQVQRRLGDLGEIFRDRRWRKRTLIGMTLGVAGQIGIWGIGFWSPELIRGALLEYRRQEVAQLQGIPVEPWSLTELAAKTTSDDAEKEVTLKRWRADEDRLVARGTLLQDLAGMLGIYTFTLVTARIGRRWAFAGAYLLALAATLFTFSQLRQPKDVYWMIPLLGFGVSSVFGGFAIYFPELFPTRLRSTGTGFFYNAARYLTALGPLTLGKLTLLYAAQGHVLPRRPAAMTLASVYVLGILVLPFAPETRGQPLPD